MPTLIELERDVASLRQQLAQVLRDQMPQASRDPEPVSVGTAIRFGVVRSIGEGTENTVSVQFLKRKSTAPYWEFDGSAVSVSCYGDLTAADYEWLLCTISGEYAANVGFGPIPLSLIDGDWVAWPLTAPEAYVPPDSLERTDAYPVGDGSGSGRSGTIPPEPPGSGTTTCPTDVSELTYTAADTDDWSGDVQPGRPNEALDQLADRVDTIETEGGGGDLNDLDDVVISDPANDDLLAYDSGNWVNKTIAALGLFLADGSIPLSDYLQFSAPRGFKDQNENILIKFSPVGSAINYLHITNACTGYAPTIYAQGSDSNIDVYFAPKGTGVFLVGGTAPGIKADDLVTANLDLNLQSKGTGEVKANGSAVIRVADSVDLLDDVDTSSDEPELNQVLKWDGSNWVPGTAGDTTEFTFSIDSFSDGISATTQLIGAGTWKAIGAITFTATYSNPPDGMTAWVAMSGSSVAWGDDLDVDPVTGPEDTVEAVSYPSSATGTIVFTLHQDADESTDTESVSFANTMRYGNSALTQGNQTEASLEALTEVGSATSPNENRSQTISNIATTANYLVFAWAHRLSGNVDQVRMNSGDGYVTAAFGAAATTVQALSQESIANVDNSAGFSETFDCITSLITGLADGSNDFQLLTQASTAQNYIRGGGNTEGTPGNYTEADIETGLTDDWVEATNDHTQTWPTVTLLASEHYVIAIPTRLGTPTFYDNDTGFEASFQDPADPPLSITNEAGFQETYNIFVSTNPLGPGDFNLRTE